MVFCRMEVKAYTLKATILLGTIVRWNLESLKMYSFHERKNNVIRKIRHYY